MSFLRAAAHCDPLCWRQIAHHLYLAASGRLIARCFFVAC